MSTPYSITNAMADQLTAKRLVHTEKSGPAFSRGLMSQLQASVASRGLVAAGDCLRAIHRTQVRDMIASWRRFTRIMGRTFPATLEPRSYAGVGLTEMVACVMANLESVDADQHWQAAEAVMRYRAQREAERITVMLATHPRISRLEEDDEERLSLEADKAEYDAYATGWEAK